VIDLHLHTTASDGRSSPRDLVRAARRARLAVIGVTDHDTVGGLAEAATACGEEGVRFVPGIEISTMRGQSEVHLLGYFIDRDHPTLLAFLEEQRADRIRRIREMLERLRRLDLPVAEEEVFADRAGGDATSGKTVGRPLIARALVKAGRVRHVREAFDLYLAEGRPAYVPRRAPDPEQVFGIIHLAGGLVSLAHPALLGHDEWIPGFAAAGLDAIEAYYIEHPPDVTARYLGIAWSLHLAVTGGSDYHGDASHGPQRPGDVALPEEEFARLEALVNRR
jgi:3',5'-nucleoside bisphosphate phosphatase